MSSAATIPILPESAPFSSPQRAWLNGFFAGLLSEGAQQGGVAVAAPPAAPPAPVEEETFPWHDPSISMTERLKLAEGKPRSRVLMAAMAQLDCGSCGYLCKTYAEAIASGTDKDITKCSPGGKDTARKLKELLALLPAEPVLEAAPAAAPAAAPTAPASVAKYDRNNPYPARFISSTQLNRDGSAKNTRHVVFDLKGSGITYSPGDALGVYADNCPESVQILIELLGAKGAEDVPALDGSHTSLREALTRDYTITRPSSELVDLLIRSATSDSDAKKLKEISQDDAALDPYEITDLLLQFRSARPSLADFVSTLSPLRPRLYSISSSQRLHPDEVHLTVGIVSYFNAFGRRCQGVASTCIGERLQPGQRCRIFVQPSHSFAPPTDGDVPMIMVGPGTGIAPFRAFLQERKATGAKGINWLFFGDQRSSTDFLYRQELELLQAEGILTRLDTAFSRDQDEKIYVQHRMLENAREIWSWLEAGACFYVCGDARRMAKDVDAALEKIVTEQGNMSPEQARAFLTNLSRNRRYQRDVY